MKLFLILILGSSLSFAAGKDKAVAKKTDKRAPAQAMKAGKCGPDAVGKAEQLLNFFETDVEGVKEEMAKRYIDNDSVKKIADVAVTVDQKRVVLDVYEVTGYIYRSAYRMRFEYAKISDETTCALMGMEILNMANPN